VKVVGPVLCSKLAGFLRCGLHGVNLLVKPGETRHGVRLVHGWQFMAVMPVASQPSQLRGLVPAAGPRLEAGCLPARFSAA
jgi:hypothetical protein